MDDLDVVRMVRPEVDQPSNDMAAAIRRDVLERVTSPTREIQRRRSAGAGWPRWAVSVPLLAGLVAVVVAVGLVVPVNTPSAAAEMLLATADRAENPATAATTTIPVDGAPTDMAGIRYMRWENASLVMVGAGDGAVYAAQVQLTRDMWVAPDGSGRIAETLESIDYLSEQDRISFEAMGDDSFEPINQDFGPGGLSYVDYSTLPTDPDKLEAVLAEIPHGDWPDNVGLLWSIQDLLRDGGTPPALRAGLYRVAAGIDGIELIGDVTDRAGRPGVGVSLTYPGNGLEYRDTMIFDPDTTALLGEETQILTASPELRTEPPITMSWFVYLDSEVVDDIPEQSS